MGERKGARRRTDGPGRPGEEGQGRQLPGEEGGGEERGGGDEEAGGGESGSEEDGGAQGRKVSLKSVLDSTTFSKHF